MIQSIYDQMWQRFELASIHNEYELDANLLDFANDTRRGITALAYLKQVDKHVLDEIRNFQKAVRAVEPNQYYHPLDELHLTVLSVISCVPDFELSDININMYSDIFLSILSSIQPIEIKYRGISASPNCIVLQGFPANNSLEQFRNKLRTQLSDSGLRVTFDSRYKLVTAHSSLIRFKTPISDSQQLFQLCQKYRNHDFGRVVLKDFDLVFNNWYQNLSVTKPLAIGSVLN